MSSFLPLPTLIHQSFFDSSLDNGKDLLVYIKRMKDTTIIPRLIDSLDPSNTSLYSESDDSLPIALCKGKRSCTNHPISIFFFRINH